MKNCPVCIDGRIMTKLSRAGEESYCVDCRKIVASSTLGFSFTASGDEGVQECKGPAGDARPGYKGPGEKARCWLYDDGNEEQKKDAIRKARNSAYSSQHKKSASRIVNATAGFTGAPSTLLPPKPDLMPTFQSGDGASSMSKDYSNTGQTPIGEVTAPNGMQPGDMNSNNPLNSGTTASTRLAELIAEDVKQYMGPSYCTEHMKYDGCNHE